MTTSTDVHSEIAARIRQAADALFDASGNSAIPTVDQVRRQARANTHDVALIMRQWRDDLKQRRDAPEPPDVVLTAAREAAGAIWQAARDAAAREHAGDRANWEAERDTAALQARELADACDAAGRELDAERERTRSLQQELETLTTQLRSDAASRQHAEAEVNRLAATEREYLSHLADMRESVNRLHAQLREERERAQSAQAEATTLRAQAAMREEVHAAQQLALRMELDACKSEHHALLLAIAGRTAVPPDVPATSNDPGKHQDPNIPLAGRDQR